MQGEPLLPTIFNVVVDTVVRHWESLVAEGSGRDDSSRKEVAHPTRVKLRARDEGQCQTEEGLKVQEAILYTEDGILASTNLGWIHTTFDTLTGLFDQVGLKTNVWKTWVWSSIYARQPGYGNTNPIPGG